MNSKVAIIGSRGIPAKYGGFETFTEEVSTRLANIGYDIYVSCEGGNYQKIPRYKGVNLFYFPLNPFYRIFYETVYDIYSMVRSSIICDSIYILGYGAGFFFFIPKIFGKKLVVNVDGIEWRRNKYNRLEKLLLYCSELIAIKFADVIVADAMAIQRYIQYSHKKDAIFIPYGAATPEVELWDSVKLNGLAVVNHELENIKPREYYLAIARLEPENNIYEIVDGYLRSNSKKKFVIVGNFLNQRYKEKVYANIEEHHASDRVIFTGGIYKKDLLNMLRQNCHVYIHGHSAGGTNPSLLEAMIMENIIIAHDNEFNREVGGDGILYFKDAEDLAKKITMTDQKIDSFVTLKKVGSNRVKDKYSWEYVAKSYDALFKNL